MANDRIKVGSCPACGEEIFAWREWVSTLCAEYEKTSAHYEERIQSLERRVEQLQSQLIIMEGNNDGR